MKTAYTFYIPEMHCNACILLSESEALEIPGVERSQASLTQHSLIVEGDWEDQTPETLAALLTKRLERHGYSIHLEKPAKRIAWSEFAYALPIAFAFVAGFVLLQKLGIVNLISGGNVSFGAAALIGVVASLSTCMAVVGGLVLSLSATFAKEGDRVKPQLLFHTGRVLGFFVLGGVIGALGSAFTLGATGTFAMSLVVGLVMLLMGLNLLDIFTLTKRFVPALPKVFAKHTLGLSKINHTLTPFVVGVATFFLPCGFTQSMQLYALSTKSALSGALTMGAFALGTLPVLALLSFSSFTIQNRSTSGIFFKSAGLIVIAFALYNLLSSFAALGIIPPLLTL